MKIIDKTEGQDGDIYIELSNGDRYVISEDFRSENTSDLHIRRTVGQLVMTANQNGICLHAEQNI
jgi:hypothetical protein